ncbi:aminotransferase [Pararhodobacter sp.]|uniref:aminotransferase n=1 Tax=Pararhodobacter sp. TaxID=2127056 RepID=UPI002AFF7D61|nr:aminotransferase [Pararhodobacter sp.]
MPLPLNPAFAATFSPPVPEARRWLSEIPLPPDLPLMNLSQAAPVDPPPAALRQAMAKALEDDPGIHLYGPVLGHPALRERLAARTQALYGGSCNANQIALTSGCNQAFCAAVATLAASGDQVIVPTPWYFNHAMWLSMSGIEAVPLPTDSSLLPDIETCAALITKRTKAIALVTPNNPGGVEYPAALLSAFADLASRHGIALIVDETYRDFHTQDGPPHTLFANPDWDQHFIHLYSFSKAYRLTGHRVGAIAAAPARLAEIEKFLDTVTICVSGPGQMAALWGLENLQDWLAQERREILRRREAVTTGIRSLRGWDLLGCGAYFAYVRHPFDAASPDVAKRLLAEAGVLMLPGTMFRPETDRRGDQELRIAFANADLPQIATLTDRLRALS